jgi:hypothetical protein
MITDSRFVIHRTKTRLQSCRASLVSRPPTRWVKSTQPERKIYTCPVSIAQVKETDLVSPVGPIDRLSLSLGTRHVSPRQNGGLVRAQSRPSQKDSRKSLSPPIRFPNRAVPFPGYQFVNRRAASSNNGMADKSRAKGSVILSLAKKKNNWGGSRI